MGRAFGALLVRYVTGQTRVCVKRYRRLLAAASRTITSRSCLHVSRRVLSRTGGNATRKLTANEQPGQWCT